MMSLALNLLVLCLFVLAGIRNFQQHKDHYLNSVVLIFTALFFIFSIVFYLLTISLDPGYVTKQPNFLQLLAKLVSENYHLDYVCIPCETLRPENAEHCNFCDRCVQKFDHHCVFVNNCVGYRNHKWFLLFLICFTLYMLGLLVHTIIVIA